MRRSTFLSLVPLLAAACLFAAPAHAAPGLLVGLTDDTIKWHRDPQVSLRKLRPLGLGALRVTLAWHPGQRSIDGAEHDMLRRSVAADRKVGLTVVLAVYGTAGAAPRDEFERENFCRFTRNALTRYTEIDHVVIWNEANSGDYWPQGETAAADYAALLGRCYDLIHQLRPDVTVLSSFAGRWGELDYIAALGAAYRASGRVTPIVDGFGSNPYPLNSAEAPAARHLDGRLVGEGDYGRLVDSLRTAFAGTGQPLSGIWYLETGYQTFVPAWLAPRYRGVENDPAAVDAATQARQLSAALKLAACQPLVKGFFNFELTDELDLGRWQSGLLYGDGERKPAFAAYAQTIAQLRAGTLACG